MKLLSLLPLLSALVSALDIEGKFAPAALLPNPSVLPASTSLTLTTAGTTRRTLIRKDNTFSFRDVPEGSYLLDVQCQTHLFTPLRVDVDRQGEVTVFQTFRGNEWSNKGERKSYPIVSFGIHLEGWTGWADGFVGITARAYGGLLCRSWRMYAFSRPTWWMDGALANAEFAVNPTKLLGSPMILVALLSLVMIVALPKLVDKSWFALSPPPPFGQLTGL
jgi:ER membrane protein complex subunit 7